MLRDFLEFLRDRFERLQQNFKASRLVLLGFGYMGLLCIMIFRLYHLQIINGESYQKNYLQKTEKTVAIPATRGNIFDANGKLLAYNRLSYNVTIKDSGEYRKALQRNQMYYRLIQILNAHGETVTGRLEIGLNENNEFYYTSVNEEARKRFLRDFYGLKRVSELTGDGGKYPSEISAEELLNKRFLSYKLNLLTDEEGKPVTLSNLEKLELVNIRYTIGLTAYRSYESTTVVTHVKDETRVDILENQAKLLGVNCEQTTERVYNDAVPFSSLIGYVGKMPDEQLKELREKNPDYTLSDTIGRTGIEEYMEQDLHGKKGSRTMYVDNVGHVMEVESETEPVAGNDVYLSIDRDLQVGIYHQLEQHLAGIVAAKLVNEDNPNTETTDSTARLIPVKDAYYQLIGNNVLSLDHMKGDSASETERYIAERLSAYSESSLAAMREQLMNPSPLNMAELPNDQRAFLYFMYTSLTSADSGVISKEKIDSNKDYYARWKADSISLREFLQDGIKDGWVNTTAIKGIKKYAGAEEVYEALVNSSLESLKTDPDFEKLLCQYMIRNNLVGGRELCLALYDQGVLEPDPAAQAELAAGGPAYAYSFFVRLVSELKITPAQLALDPCTAGCVVTDVTTGKVKALVSYPGYDNNRLTNTMDAKYYNRLVKDESLPLYNNATQARKAPGSTFKPITAIAALEENVVGLNDTVNCTGIYDAITPPLRCWIYPGRHGVQNIVAGIRNSCNVFFADLGHRLATNPQGEYDPALGIARLNKYATMFGLDQKSGVEIIENDPMISDQSPEQSAIGQGTNSFANVQLSRYVTALANRGTVFDLSVLDRVTDWQGEAIRSYDPNVIRTMEVKPENWDAVQQGMRGVVESGSASRIFKGFEVNIAGKTGTAQESKTRANHAFFISFGPYESPKLAVTVNIPYGYTSANAASVAKDVYRLCFGYTNVDEILNAGAQRVSDANIED
ncbi:penicillin-binding transpeptidase domain-containing protein [Stomatobaculum longum]|uniref:penicillin-binding transpeptidase domain-containing protein n=1 Tax=Stomatobaculum longum TaxID=796942 RepID=UPI0028F0EDE2|nr:penicillin-binding transpeptidase domain-containing protein [Stomatobaculum longum]